MVGKEDLCDSQFGSQFDQESANLAAEQYKRLLEATNSKTDRELAGHLGIKPQTIHTTRSRNACPPYDAGEKGDIGEYVPELDMQISIIVANDMIAEAYLVGLGPSSMQAVALNEIFKQKRKVLNSGQARLPGVD